MPQALTLSNIRHEEIDQSNFVHYDCDVLKKIDCY